MYTPIYLTTCRTFAHYFTPSVPFWYVPLSTSLTPLFLAFHLQQVDIPARELACARRRYRRDSTTARPVVLTNQRYPSTSLGLTMGPLRRVRRRIFSCYSFSTHLPYVAPSLIVSTMGYEADD